MAAINQYTQSEPFLRWKPKPCIELAYRFRYASHRANLRALQPFLHEGRSCSAGVLIGRVRAFEEGSLCSADPSQL